jgi:hypothetical protein
VKKVLNITVTLLLLLNGMGALYGGWSLINHPDGSHIQLSMHWLEHTPFRDYLIPGIILFIANGIFSLVVVTSILFRWQNSFQFVTAQGLILMGWIIVQMLLIQTIHFLHIILGTMGLFLIVIGRLLKRMEVNPGRNQ